MLTFAESNVSPYLQNFGSRGVGDTWCKRVVGRTFVKSELRPSASVLHLVQESREYCLDNPRQFAGASELRSPRSKGLLSR